MPVTFNDELNQGTVYVDPVFRYDTATRLLGRDQYQNKVVEFSSNQPSRSGTPLSEYTRAYSRCGSPNNEAVNALPANIAEVDQACYEKTTGLQNADKLTYLAKNLSSITSQYEEDTCSASRDDVQLRDYHAKKAFYTTSTQKLYQGVDWNSRMTRSPAPPKTSKEENADTVSYRYEAKRYDPKNENWQKFGSRPFSWDYLQSRDGYHIPGPVRFCSPHRKTAHLPGYMGHVGGGPGEMDDPKSQLISLNKQRTLQPKYYTNTARKGNIPGYTGCVLFYEHEPAGINDPEHLRSTTASAYRSHEEFQCNCKSPFKKSSPMSRMVTLTYPFNPFNKVY